MDTSSASPDLPSVLILSPATKGGMSRMVTYMTDEWRDHPELPPYRVLDTHGTRHPWLSVFPMLRACGVLILSFLRNDIGVVHINITIRGSTFRKAPICFLARLLRIPFVLHLHGGRYEGFYAGLNGPTKAFVRAVFHSANRVIVLGNSWKEFAIQTLQLPPERIVVLPNAVPGPKQLPEKSADRKLRILFLGLLSENKGVSELVEALSADHIRALTWSAVFAGHGDIDHYKRKALELGIAERIDFIGWVDAERTNRLLADSDILILPSRNEALPLVILEGMAHGLAIIATPVGSIPEVLENEKTAILVPPRNVSGLSTAIHRMLTDEELRERLSATARAKFLSDYSISEYLPRMFDIYRQCNHEYR